MSTIKRLFLISELAFPVILIIVMAPIVQATEPLSWGCSVATPTSPCPASIPTPTSFSTEVELKIEGIEERLDDIQMLVEVQSNTCDATVSRMESNLNLLIAILAIASLLAAILGFGVVRIWIRSLVEDRLRQITSQDISHQVDKEVSRIRDEWEPKFAELYEEYRRLVKGSHHEC